MIFICICFEVEGVGEIVYLMIGREFEMDGASVDVCVFLSGGEYFRFELVLNKSDVVLNVYRSKIGFVRCCWVVF